MATRTVTLNADGIAEREVMYVRYELNQQTDVEGQPTGTTRGGKIYFKVKSNDDGNTDLLEWMCDTYMAKSGTISWPNRQGGEMKRPTTTRMRFSNMKSSPSLPRKLLLAMPVTTTAGLSTINRPPKWVCQIHKEWHTHLKKQLMAYGYLGHIRQQGIIRLV